MAKDEACENVSAVPMNARASFLALALTAGTSVWSQTTPTPIDPFADNPKGTQVPAAPAVGSPISEDSMKLILKLEQATKEFDSKKKDIANAALAKYTSAAMSELAAAQFYLTCQQMVQDRLPDLDGVSKKDIKDKQDRTKQQAERIEDTPGRAAVLQMQVQYLVLTMEAPAMKDEGALVSRVHDFMLKAVALVKQYAWPVVEDPQKKPVATVASAARSKREQEKVRDEKEAERHRREIMQLAGMGVMGSIFAQAYNLQNYFKPREDWPNSPLDLDHIFTGVILPYRHVNKPELLESAWDEFIGLMTTVQRCSTDERGYSKWLIGGYKGLLWRKWQDLYQYGVHKATAVDELVKLVKENPTHSDIGTWAGELTTLAEQLKNPNAVPATPPMKPAP